MYEDIYAKRACYDETYSLWKSWNKSGFGRLQLFEKQYFDRELKRAKCNFPSDAKVLEIGFGNGKFLTYARTLGWSVVGVEANEQLVGFAESQEFDVYHANNLSFFEPDQFDLIVAFDVLEHLPKDELIGWFFEINRILKEDGCFIARFPNGDSPLGLLHQNGDVTHASSIGSIMVKCLAERVGITIVYLGGEAQPLVGKSPTHTLHHYLTWPVKFLINMVVRLLFFPKARVDFCALNYTLICKKTSRVCNALL